MKLAEIDAGDLVEINKRGRVFEATIEKKIEVEGKPAKLHIRPTRSNIGYFDASPKEVKKILVKAPPTKLDVRIPGKVWDDFLDPRASGMQAELGLGEPRHVRRGRGTQAVYDNVPAESVLELAEYLRDRGNTLLAQGIDDPYDPEEKATRDVYRSAVKTAESLVEALA